MTRLCLTLLALCLLWTAGAVHAESYLGLLSATGGNVADATVTATQTQAVCPTPPCSQTVASRVQFNRQHMAGIRGGIWYGTYGLGWEYTISGVTSVAGPTASAANVEVNFDTLSLLALARTPMLTWRHFPDSYLYAGVGASAIYGRFSVAAPPLPPMSGTTQTAGLMFLGGGTILVTQHVMLFGEWRVQDLTFDYTSPVSSLNIPVRLSEIVFGAAWAY